MNGDSLRVRLAKRSIRSAGIIPSHLAEHTRNLANFALGAGSASLAVGQSGEGLVLRDLAAATQGPLTIFDVGAHTGEWAEAARSAFGARAAIHCFEPNPTTYRALGDRHAGDSNTVTHALAMGAQPGSVELFVPAASDTSTMASIYEQTFDAGERVSLTAHTVEMETVGRVAEKLGITRVDVLKIDVEGHELAVLEGAQELLERRAIDVIQFEFGERSIPARTYLRDFVELLSGYELFRVTPRGLRRLEYNPGQELFLFEANYLARLQ